MLGPILLIEARCGSSSSFLLLLLSCDSGKNNQRLLRPTEVQLGLQDRLEFDKKQAMEDLTSCFLLIEFTSAKLYSRDGCNTVS